MKAFYFLALAMFASFSTVAQTDTIRTEDQPYYVVIGVFSVQKNAVRYARQAPKYKLTARYEMNFNKGLHYVYVLKTGDRQTAIDEALRLRARPDSLFSDTWVYHGSFTKPLANEVVQNKKIELPADQSGNVKSTSAEKIEKEEVKPFLFKMIRTDGGADVAGEVVVVDVDVAKKIGAYESNKTVSIAKPKGKSGNITVTSHVPGFRRVQHTINYLHPESDTVEMQDSTIVVTFQLTRLQKGDVAVSEIYFFRDAVVMRPESRFEVTSILDMMRENPKYKIKIHGHTNGGGRGRIISMKEPAEDWFSINNTKEGSGSAKKLSKQRAEVVKKFLVSNGIDEKRMVVKAWGGKKPIYDQLGPQAQSNVRVEIEILDN